MKRLVALVLATTTTACIRTVEERELIVERLIDPAPGARALPRCDLPPLGDVSRWRRAERERVALPETFDRETGPLPRAVMQHGGASWKDPAGRTFRRIDGHYDVSRHPDACHASIDGALMVIVAGADSTGYWVDAWPVSRSAAPTPRYDAVGFDAADPQLFLRILQTYRAPDDDE